MQDNGTKETAQFIYVSNDVPFNITGFASEHGDVDYFRVFDGDREIGSISSKYKVTLDYSHYTQFKNYPVNWSNPEIVRDIFDYYVSFSPETFFPEDYSLYTIDGDTGLSLGRVGLDSYADPESITFYATSNTNSIYISVRGVSGYGEDDPDLSQQLYEITLEQLNGPSGYARLKGEKHLGEFAIADTSSVSDKDGILQETKLTEWFRVSSVNGVKKLQLGKVLNLPENFYSATSTMK